MEEEHIQELATESSDERKKVGILKYYNLVKNNHALRWCWISEFISLCGDWFNELACVTILNKYTNSAFVMTSFLLCRDAPPIIWSPLAGVIADKYDRRRVMLCTDLISCAVVLLFLLVQSKDTLWLLFVVAFLHFSVAAFFEPAASAFLPQIVHEEDLVAANVLTWSFLLVAGAGLGGVFTFYFGTAADFLVDSSSFLLSAFCMFQLFKYPLLQVKEEEDQTPQKKKSGIVQSMCSEFIDGLRFLRQNKFIWAITVAKASYVVIGSASELFMVNYAAEKFQIGDNVSLSLGIMYVSSGIGTAVGPAVVELLVPDSTRNNVLTIVMAFFVLLVGSITRVYCNNFIIFCLANMVETSGSGCIWVYSSSLLQRLVPNHIMGRCSSFEAGAMTVTSVLSKLLYSVLRDTCNFSSVAIMAGITLGGIPILALWVAFAVVTKGTDPTPFQAVDEEEEPLTNT